MAATRFYFPAEGSGAPNISPTFDVGWEQTGSATRLKLLRKLTLSTTSTLADDTTRTVPITTTQDVLCNQFISDTIPSQLIDTSCTLSSVIRVLASATTENCTLAYVVKVVSNDGTIVRGTLLSNFNAGAAFVATAATRILAATAVTAVTAQPGDRLLVELGAHAAAPSTSGTYTMRQGTSAATDFALTSALTTDLNPWIEFSTDLYGTTIENYRAVKVGDGLSSGERIR